MFPYTSPSAGAKPAFGFWREGSHDGQRKADLSAEHPATGEAARLSPPDADAGGPGDPGGSPSEAPEPSVRLQLNDAVRTAGVQRVFRDGRPVHGTRMVLFVAPGSGEFALVAGRKVGGAVERNRARRVLRAALREVAPRGMEGHDIVLVAREAIRGARTQDLIAEMTELLWRGEPRP